jgi:hypothetical protein
VFGYKAYDEERFINRFKQMLRVESVDRSEVPPVRSDREFRVSAESLRHPWGMGIVAAKRTFKATTQRCVRTVAFPSVEWRWPTGDRPLRYHRLNHAFYHDALYSRVTSLRGNKCRVMYAMDFGWSRNFKNNEESDVHETLDLCLARYEVPEVLISDRGKVYTGGWFRQNGENAGCFCKITVSYSPWKNLEELENSNG